MVKYFTKQGLKKLKEELKYLKTTKHKEIVEQLRVAAGFGDFSENAAYDQAKEAKAFLRGRIAELEKALVNAQVIEKSADSKVQLGSTITIQTEDGDNTIFTIVRPEESDLDKGKLSSQSPIGQALLGKHEGDEVKIVAHTYKIIKVE